MDALAAIAINLVLAVSYLVITLSPERHRMEDKTSNTPRAVIIIPGSIMHRLLNVEKRSKDVWR